MADGASGLGRRRGGRGGGGPGRASASACVRWIARGFGALGRLFACCGVISAAGPAPADGLPGIAAPGGIAGIVLPPELARAGSSFAGAALATLIREGAAEAERAGLRPMSPDMRARMASRFPDAVLARVRWGVAAQDAPLRRIVFEVGDAAAVTLGRVVLFDDARGAGDARLWAHELTHVMQYERWGIDGFAQRYVVDMRGVEAEAVQAERDLTGGDGTRTQPAHERRPVQRPYRWDGG